MEELIAKIAELNWQQKELTTEFARLKPVFETIVKDRTVDQNVRWNIWTSAPTSLKKSKGWIEHVVLPDHGEISWYDDFYKDRYQVIESADIAERMEEDDGDKWSQRDIGEFKEWVLSNNIHSFKNDW